MNQLNYRHIAIKNMNKALFLYALADEHYAWAESYRNTMAVGLGFQEQAERYQQEGWEAERRADDAARYAVLNFSRARYHHQL
jgi:hypothetical protein